MAYFGCAGWQDLVKYFEEGKYDDDREEFYKGKDDDAIANVENSVRRKTIFDLNGHAFAAECHYVTGMTYIRRWYDHYRSQQEAGNVFCLDRVVSTRKTTIGSVRCTERIVTILVQLKKNVIIKDYLGIRLGGIPFVIGLDLDYHEIEGRLVMWGAFVIGFDEVEWSRKASGVELVYHHYAKFAVHNGSYSHARGRAAKLKLYTVTDKSKLLQPSEIRPPPFYNIREMEEARAATVITCTTHSFDDIVDVAQAASLISSNLKEPVSLPKLTIKFVLNFKRIDSARIAYRKVEKFEKEGHTVSIFFEDGFRTLAEAEEFLQDKSRFNTAKNECKYKVDRDEDRPDFLVCALDENNTTSSLSRLTMPVQPSDDDDEAEKNCDAFDIVRHESETNTVSLIEFGSDFLGFVRYL